MKKLAYFCLFMFGIATAWGCSDSGTGSGPDPGGEQASSEKQFVYNAMNYWYYWQGDVPELADDYFENNQAKQDYLNGFSDARAVFNALLYDQEDDFSFFIDDYEEFEQSQQGISESFGYSFGLVCQANPCNELFGYVQYVLNGSPADQAELQRGDVFTSVDGTRLTVNNYRNLLFGATSYELTLAQPQSDGSLEETSETVSMQAVTLQENPIYLSKVIEAGSSTVGYLMYNGFQSNSHQNLNDVFGNFINQGVNELVVDLRYNGGGAVVTSAILAGMISGRDENSEFAQFTFNNKRSAQNQSFPIYDYIPGDNNEELPMNQLSLSRVYFLVDFGTASASEALINGLDPYMDVTYIGTQTVGKDEGSLTFYDAPAPYTDQSRANENHKEAIQPIILKIVNTNGRNYPEGFTPQGALNVNERSYLFENQNLPPLGSEEDPLLANALEEINGVTGAMGERARQEVNFDGYMFKDSRDMSRIGKSMYLLPETAQKFKLPGSADK